MQEVERGEAEGDRMAEDSGVAGFQAKPVCELRTERRATMPSTEFARE